LRGMMTSWAIRADDPGSIARLVAVCHFRCDRPLSMTEVPDVF
jgi:hypothetical protein